MIWISPSGNGDTEGGLSLKEGAISRMAIKCITVYTKSYETFSDIFEQVVALDLAENEEREVEGITISDCGEVVEEYIDTMKQKPEVAVMKVRDRNITILQHGDVFEMLIPEADGLHE